MRCVCRAGDFVSWITISQRMRLRDAVMTGVLCLTPPPSLRCDAMPCDGLRCEAWLIGQSSCHANEVMRVNVRKFHLSGREMK
ncbi:hypothetical protein Cob_v006048 [Colletotrichum orbiculare MAFF 240422]|uniref:Uncharacterized protein n=1 Tax=Colletotrichum orbiculare (strain 104-T / ATCC 96160 / CBS 514.97 / LARS 414 / MAFF 240422) TaxID=1213857 RepID=A0A484FT47_COLOR|nr:hypothetical protein Cob_v006048 [Colletotrichum orbiculare MAFF 240422]